MNWNAPERREQELQNTCLHLQDRLEEALFKSHIYSFIAAVLAIALVVSLATR